MAGGAELFVCPSCGKQYKWTVDLAGKKVRCAKCNLKVRIPATANKKAEALEPIPPKPSSGPGGPTGLPASAGMKPPSKPPAPQSTDDQYDLNLDDDFAGLAPKGPVQPITLGPGGAPTGASGGGGNCPSCNAKVKPGAVICLNCGFNLQSGKKIKTAIAKDMNDAPGKTKPPAIAAGAATAAAARGGVSGVARALDDREDDAQPSAFIDLWLPLGLIVIGIGVNFAEQFYFTEEPATSLIAAGITIGIDIAIQVPLLLIAMLLAVKLLGVAFGPLGKALFKLIAIVLGPSAIGTIIAYLIDGGDMIGFFVGSTVSFGLFWGLLSALFDLEGLEALYLMFILWIVQWVAGIIAVMFILSIFFA